jgi:hypothetical protein
MHVAKGTARVTRTVPKRLPWLSRKITASYPLISVAQFARFQKAREGRFKLPPPLASRGFEVLNGLPGL